MSPIAQFLATRLQRELAASGAQGAEVSVVGGGADDWHYRIAVGARSFETGFNHRNRFWCRDVTPGRERDLVSNDGVLISTSEEARRAAVKLIALTVAHPRFPAQNPPVI